MLTNTRARIPGWYKYREVISSGRALYYSYVIIKKKKKVICCEARICSAIVHFRIVRARKRTFSLITLHQLYECKSSFNNTRYTLII